VKRTRLFALATVLALAACDRTPPSTAPDPAAGQVAFRQCASCHQVGPSARAGFGPQLNGIVGRRAAATTDYTYSTALRNSGLVWTDEALAAYIRNPDALVPGTKMRFLCLGCSDRVVADLIAYLRTLPTTE
jgi:cytochrome c